jgi:hypothetical protein
MRQADRDLLDALRRRQFCYVLDSRQVGKSSLMVRTAAGLRAEGARVAVLDLSAYGQNVSAEQWYFGMLFAVADQLHLEDEMEAFWLRHTSLGLVQRWVTALRQVALAGSAAPLILFVDEIDAVKSLSFSTDEFFAAIRECYNHRALDGEFERLTFCLLGVTTPADLVRDARTTPFNIGRRVLLADFTPEEAAPLSGGMSVSASTALSEGLLQRVLHWTGGHPYLTQRLCSAVAHRLTELDGEPGSSKLQTAMGRPRGPKAKSQADSQNPCAIVDPLCEALFLSRQARDTDDNLSFVRRRMLGESAGAEEVAAILTLYARVLAERPQIRNDATDPRIATLLLSGVVRTQSSAEGDVLATRNRIYATVFDRHWVRSNMPDAEVRRPRAAFWKGYARASLIWLIALAGLGLAVWQSQVARAKTLQLAGSLVRIRGLQNQENLLNGEIYAAGVEPHNIGVSFGRS